MSNKIRIEKLQSIIFREIVLIIQKEIKNDLLKNNIYINEVKLTSDLRYAKIYYSLFYNNNNNFFKLDKILKKYNKEIRNKLANKLNTKYCPIIEFIYDKNIDKINRIEEILKKINN